VSVQFQDLMVQKQIYDKNASSLQSVKVSRPVVQLRGRHSGFNSWGFSCSYEQECPLQLIEFQGKTASNWPSIRHLLENVIGVVLIWAEYFFSFNFDSWNFWFVW